MGNNLLKPLISETYTSMLNASSLRNRFMLRAKFRHMQILVVLADLGSMRRAAQHLNMTQPAISQMVAELERLVEVDLFLRHARGVRLTAPGRELLPAAEKIISTIGDAAERVTNASQNGGDIVHVAASASALGALLHGRMAEFAAQHPNTLLQISALEGTSTGSSSQEASPDLICLREPAVLPEGWSFVDCAPDQLSVVCHKSHPLAETGSASLKELGECAWLMHRVGSIARNHLEYLAEANGWTEIKSCRINLHIPELTREILSTGQYLALLPGSVLRPWISTGEFIELATPAAEPIAPLGVLWQPDRAGPSTRKVLDFLRRDADLLTAQV